jgi:ATP-dependent DNA helicase DinG
MSSSDRIHEILGADGLLSRSLPNFEVRASQNGMARVIAEAVEREMPALVEAGTGTGKTLGYLVPLWLSDKKSVISTRTKTLQEQIFFKDIPVLARATGHRLSAMLMKGRKNYLCLRRYHQYFTQASLLSTEAGSYHKRLQKWLQRTRLADRAELAWLRDDDPLWEAISSTAEQCHGSRCLHGEDCYLNALRREAARSRIIIANHHLLFADLMVKESGFGEVLPRFEVLVCDEAHGIEEIATQYFGNRLSDHQLIVFIDDVEEALKKDPLEDDRALKSHLASIRAGAIRLRDLFGTSGPKGRLTEASIEMINQGPALGIREGLNYIQQESSLQTSHDMALQALASRAADLGRSLAAVLAPGDPNSFAWYERLKKSIVLHASPVEIAESMQKLLYQKVKTIVFTSATLSTNGNFDYLRSRLGLSDELLEGIYPSHFDYVHQALLYVPRDLPPPSDPGFGPKVAERILEVLNLTAGRALVLFTSYTNLNLVHQLCGPKISYPLYKQGDGPRSFLLDKFRRETHSVLLATGSFWQGVDVPGESLSCLIIDKLPFDSPAEPLVAARIGTIKKRGGNPFRDYQLPSAIIALKQGLGRLIRSSTDCGILSIMDTRLLKSGYGRTFFDNLPGMPRCHDLADIGQFFEARSGPRVSGEAVEKPTSMKLMENAQTQGFQNRGTAPKGWGLSRAKRRQRSPEE